MVAKTPSIFPSITIVTCLALVKPLIPLARHISALFCKQVRSLPPSYFIFFGRAHIVQKQRKSPTSKRTTAQHRTAQSTVRATSAN